MQHPSSSLIPYALHFRGIGATIRLNRRDRAGAGTMPYSFDFDLTYGILRCRLAGPITDEVLEDFFRVGARHARRTRPVAGVIDLSEVTSFEVSAETIGQIARTTPVLTDPELQRIVIAPTPTLFGAMRLFATEGEETRPNIQVVRTEQEALTILGVRYPRFNIIDPR